MRIKYPFNEGQNKEKEIEIFNKWCVSNNIKEQYGHPDYRKSEGLIELFSNWRKYIPNKNNIFTPRNEIYSFHCYPFYCCDNSRMFDINELVEDKYRHVYSFQLHKRVFVYHPDGDIIENKQRVIDLKNICKEMGLNCRIFSNEYSWYKVNITSMVELRIEDIEKFIEFIKVDGKNNYNGCLDGKWL